MTMITRFILGLACALLCVACTESAGSTAKAKIEAPTAAKTKAALTIMGQLEAALAIENSSARDVVLHKVALAAAGEGLQEEVKKAVKALASTSLRDVVARTCAMKFAKAYVDGQDALTIGSQTLYS